MGIQKLPSELLSAVMGHLARMPPKYTWVPCADGFNALRNCRLVCHEWNHAASQHLFCILHLKHQQPPDPSEADEQLQDDNEEDQNNRLEDQNSSMEDQSGNMNDQAESEQEDSDPNERYEEEQRKVIFNRWHQTLDLDVARASARRVVVDSIPDWPEACPDGTEFHIWWEWERTVDGKIWGFDDALDRLAELPSLEAVEVHFRDKCAGKESDAESWRDEHEPLVPRQSVLKKVFRAIRERKLRGATAGEGHRSTVTSLALKNLQNVVDTNLEGSSLFKSVIEDIRQLHLHILTEYNENGPDWDVYREERVTFELDLQAGLLASVASHLTMLTLSFNDFWGTMPGYFNGEGLLFPCLQTLHLRKFAISHDDHFDWVLRMPALTSLILSETKIMTHAKVDANDLDAWNLRTHDWQRLPTGAYGFDIDYQQVFTYARRWHYFFDRIRSQLEKLTDFRISWQEQRFPHIQAPWTDLPKPNTLPELSLERYLVFQGGWNEPEHSGAICFGDNQPDPNGPREDQKPMNVAMQHQASDAQALRALLEATWARRF